MTREDWTWVGMFVVFIAVLFLMITYSLKEREACERACDPVVSRRMDGFCFCKSSAGWIRAHEVDEAKN